MYLKSIEIQGFKSFANKIRLEFQPGFTGIVGPNGSGKSNIADAVRWVLGEQRIKQLRGGSMQDVIFSGTQTRKPLSFAYVAITMDNADHALATDFKEVTVARRLYRSGASEYILNGTNVRLRDVQELFMDTGIGKEGYSIIGQGQIDKILSDKPEDRRELFDEAAGIVKFKHRKEEALRKLDSEQSNLTRVNDILSELEKQVGPLQEQSEKAQKYLAEREALRRLDVNIFLLENARTEGELQKLKIQSDNATQQLEETTQRLQASKDSYEAASQALASLDKELESARSRITQASIVRQKQENDIRLYEEQIRSAQSNASHFEQRQKTLTVQIEDKKRELDDCRKENNRSDEEISAVLQNREKAQEQLLFSQKKEEELSHQIDALRNGNLDLLNQQAQQKARQAALSAKKEQLTARAKELETQLTSTSDEEEAQDSRIQQMQAQAAAVEKDMQLLLQQQQDIAGSLEEKKQQLTAQDGRLREAEGAYHQEKSRLDALTNLTERYEGFGSSVRHVMEQKPRESGLVGVVADLIKTKAQYETAIEVALGGSIQNIVTRDEATARRMIQLLKKDHAGRATFLPLSNIRQAGFTGSTSILREKGVIGTADTLVQVAPEYQSVASFLLGRIIVADTFEHAAAAERKYEHKVRMVTLEGELFTPGGAISGGAYRNSSNLLGRRRELAELAEKTKSLQEQIRTAQAAIDQTKAERNIIRARNETVRMQLQNKTLEKSRLELLVRQEEERREESQEGQKALQREQEEIRSSLAALEKEEQETAQGLSSFAKQQEENESAVADLLLQQKQMRAAEDAQTQEVSGIDVELEKLRTRAAYQKETLDRLTQELEHLSQELEETRNGIAQGSVSVEEKKQQIVQTRQQIASSKAAEEQAKEVLSGKNQERKELTARQEALLAQRDSCAEDKARLDKEVYRLTARIQQLEEAMDSQVGYIWSEYQLTLSQAEALRDPSLQNLPSMRTEAKKHKDSIHALGNVNVNAIEEYHSVSQRYEFLKGQKDDLVKAADALKKIISELDENMRRQFKEQFARIQQEFDAVFKELFGGGSGRLELMEGEDLLTAGVRVIAQPPGKKLVNMMQMSGGEKALTAISLLFAIQNLKPSPFCLLDEIEAALDESNVIRFADYIHKLTAHTQFIVITHRRGTMDRCDRLYGITMQEKGVSTLVSVSLIDEKDLTA